MRFPILVGIIGGVVIAILQFISMTNEPGGSFGWLLYYSPLIFYFMCIYMSVKKVADTPSESKFSFKDGLKAGGLTALIISFIWAIGIFVGITHTDIRALVNYKIQHHETSEIKHVLVNFSRQGIFDQTKFFSMPNFLLGFVMTVLVSVVFLLRRKR